MIVFLLLAIEIASSSGQVQMVKTPEDVPMRTSELHYKMYDTFENVDYGSILFPRDLKSGCICREYTRRYFSCFDIERCKHFPRRVIVTLPTLKVTTTAIQEFVKGDLENIHHVTVLLIEANNELRYFEPGIFQNMSKLTNLTMSYNPNLMSLEVGVFDGLTHLQELLLAKNGFDETKDFSLSLSAESMPRLYRLNLKELRCADVDKGDFANLNGSAVLEFNFVNSQIEYIHPEAFAPMNKLQALRIGGNNINMTTLIDLVKKITELKFPLRTLGLSDLGFRVRLPKPLLEVIANSSITRLSLSKNQFDIIGDNSFPPMPNLEYLDLSDVLVGNITLKVFSGMPKLKTLLLNKNKFSFIPEAVLLSNLTDLDLSENSGTFDVQSYFTLEKNKLLNMTNLWRLNLSKNNIRKIPKGTFNGADNLKVLGFKNAAVYLIDDGAFSNLKELLFLNLEENKFPTRNYNKNIFLGLDRLEVLLLGYCGIKFFPGNDSFFEHVPSLKHLDLRGNSLKSLSPVMTYPLQSLYSINFAQNAVFTWQERMFSRNKLLRIMVAYENKFPYLSKAMLEDISSLKQLDISKNPFNCECYSFSALENFGNSQKLVKIQRLISESPSHCVYPDEYINTTITEYFKLIQRGEICQFNILEHSFVLIAPLTVLGVIILILAIIFYVYRWHIRYWIFLTKLALTRNKQFTKRKNMQCYTNYEYDAFVSYSNEDRNFVVRLVAMLENYEPFLKLCVYERDFQIGTVISETVLESVARSRKTLLIISDSYIKSQWCRWEAQVAEHHRLFFENEHGECVNDSIVMIKLGNISRTNLSPMLKYLMKTRIYLQWDSNDNKQQQFWEKLRNALAPPVVNRF